MSEPIRILVVEDLPTDYDLAKREIRKVVTGCVFQQVETSKEFLEALENFQPDVILADYHLPRFDGMKALKLAQEHAPLTPLIIWTGSLSEDVAVDCMKAGANNYILKENIKRLGPAVVHALEERRLILERKEVEDKLRRSESKYRALTENSLQGIAIFQQGKIVYVNRAMCTIMGHTAEELLAMSEDQILALTHPDDRVISQERMRKRQAGEVVPPYNDVRILRGDGTTGWIQTFVNSIEYDGQPAILSTSIDITERKQAEQTIRDLARFPEENPSPIFRASPDGKILYANSASRNFLDNWKTSVGGYLPVEWNEIITDVYRNATKKAVDISIQGRTYATLIMPIREAGYINIYGRDITERKQAEEALQSRVEELATLHATLLDITNTHDLPSLLQAIVERATRLLHGEGGGLYLCIPERQEAQCVVTYKTPRDYTGTILKYGEGAAGKVAITGQPLIIDDYRVWPGRASVYETEQPFRSLISVPMLWQGQVTGVIHVVRYTEDNPFDKDDLDLLTLFASHATIAVENSNLIQNVKLELFQRKQAEDTLRQSEERLRNIFDNSSEGIFQSTPEGRFLSVNPAMARIYGYASPQEMIESVTDIARQLYVETQDRNEFTGLFITGGSVENFEMKNYRKDGSIFWTTTSARAVRDTDGNILYYEGFLQDITERKQADGKLREQEKRFRALIENSLDNISLLAEDGALLWENTAVVRTLGYGQDTFIGRNIFELMHPDDLTWTSDLFVKLTEEPGSQQHGTFRLQHQDGTWRWNEAIATNMLDEPGVRAIVINYRDVTEHKQAEIERQALFEIMQGQTSTEDLQGFLKLVHQTITTAIYAENFFIVIYDKATGLFEEIYSVDKYDPPAPPLRLEKSISSYVFRKEEPIIMTQALFDELAEQGEVELVGTNSESWMGAPLKTPVGTIGIMVVQDYEYPNRYSERDKDFLTSIAAQVALAIERKRAEVEIRQRNEELALINTLNEAINRGETLDGMVNILAKEMKRIFSSEGTTIYILDQDERFLTMQQYFLSPELTRKIEKVIGHTIPLIQIPIREGGYFEKVLQSGRGAITSDPKEIQNWMEEFVETTFLPPITRGAIRKLIPHIFKLLNIKSTILVPLISDGRTIGLLDVSSPNLFTEEDLKRIENIGGQLTTAIRRKQVEDKVRRSEEFLQSIQNALSASIAILDEEGTIVQVNSAWRKFGEQNGLRHPEYGIGLNYLDICDSATGPNAEEASVVANAIREVIAGRKREAWVEYPCHSPREKRWFILQITKFEDGDQIWVVLAHENITERKQAEEALKETSEQFRTLFEASPEAIMLVDPRGDWPILDCNATGCAMNGYMRDELVGQSVDVFNMSPGTPTERTGYLESVRNAGILRYETFHRRKDGSVFPIEVSTSLITLGGRDVILGIDRDITERKKAEDALQQSEHRYRALFEDMPVAVWEEDFSEVNKYLDSLKEQGITDFRGYFASHPDATIECAGRIRILSANNAAMQMYRAENKEDLIRGTVQILSKGELDYIHEDFIAVAERRTSHGWEGADVTLKGEPIEISLNWSVVPGYEDDYSRIIVTTTDITERKQAEEALRESEEKYRLLFDDNPLPLWIYDLETLEFLKVNQAAVHNYGYSVDEFMSMTIKDIRPSEDLPALFDYLANFADGIEEAGVWRHRKKDGTIIQVEIISHPVEFAGRNAKLILAIDITERKRVENAEREQRALAEALRETAETLNSTLEYGEVLDHILAAAGRVVPHDAATIMLIDRESAYVVRSHGYDKRGFNDEIMGIKLPLVETINLRQMLETGQPVVVPDTRTYPGWRKLPATDWLRSNVGAPISIYGETIGFILLDSETPGFFTPVHAERLVAFANQAALAIHNAHLLKQAQEEIAERKRAEAQVNELLAFNEKVLNNSPVGILTYKLTGECIFANDKAASIVGTDIEHLKSQNYHEIDSWKKSGLYDLAEKAVRREDALISDIHNVSTFGKEFWVTAHCVKFRSNEEDHLLLMISDITERKQAEEELKRSHSLLNATLESTTDGILVVGPDRTVSSFNQKFLELWRIPYKLAAQKDDRTLLDFILSQLKDPSAFIAKVEALYQSSDAASFDELEFIDGRVFERYSKPQRLGNAIVGRVWSFRDITERKQAENELRASEERFKQLANNIQEAFWMTDAESGKELYMSPATEVIWKRPVESLIHEPDAFINTVFPEDQPAVLRAIGKEKNGEKVEMEYRIVQPDGSIRWIWDRAFPIFDDSGRTKSIAGISADITERKRAEEEVRRRAEETSALLKTSLALTDLDLDAILQGIGNSAKMLFTADGCRIFLMQPDGESLRCVLALQENSIAFSDLRIKLGNGVTGAVAASGRAEIVNEMQNDPRAVQVPGTVEKEEEAIMFAPLKERDRSLGVLSVRRAGTERPFEPADLELLEAFASMAASAVSNARMFEETQRRLAELEALYENGLAVGQLLEPREIGERIIESFARHLSWHHVAIRLKHPESDDLGLIAFNQPGLSNEERTEIERHFNTMISKVGRGLSGWVVQTGEPLRTGNVQSHPQYVDTHPGIQSGLYMPLRIGERIIGVISVESEEASAFTAQDERLLATLANQAAIAFENARLYQSAQQEIAERKRVENELRGSQERFQELFENSPVATWLEDFLAVVAWMDKLRTQGVKDLKGYLTGNPEEYKFGVSLIRILNVNQAAVLMNGARNKQELINKVHELMVDETPSPVMVNELEMIWNGYTSFGFEISSRKLDGSLITGIQRIYIPINNNRPDYARVIVTSTDITERVNIEQELRTSEVHYRELADSITDIFFELDQNLHYSHWNKASEALTGLPAEDAIGKSMREVFGDSEEQNRIGRIYKDVLIKHESITFETALNLNGLERAFEINAYPSTRGIAVVAKDVTDRKQSEVIMQKRLGLMEYSSHHGLQELMQKSLDEISEFTHSAIGFFQFMGDDQMTPSMQMWSTNSSKQFQLTESERTHLPVDQAGVWAEAVRLRRTVVHNDYKSLSGRKGLPEGHAGIVRELVIPIIRNEKIVGVMGIGNKTGDYTQKDVEIAERFADYAWDITERKQMETELADERNQLAKRVEERTADLSRANSNLARALRVKDEFLANMSHELRTPLNAILGLSESLVEQTAGPLNEKQQRYITTISESGHHLLSLINDILDLAKIEAGQITLDINKVDVNSVCQGSLRMIKQLSQKKNLDVSVDIDENIGLMWADERRLKQMIVNLLSNAVKFTPENGRIGLEINGDQDENKVMITVWDTGIGIKENDFQRLFQPFVQLDSGLARESTGTGLGLALVAQMARLHGGSVSASSEPGKGSRFTIVLPWEPALTVDTVERMKVTGKFRAIRPGAQQQTILLIEDTKEVTMMISDYLEINGYKVVAAEDGIDGINQAKLTHPDLILMDIQMPRMDGLEATRKLRSDPAFKFTPIIALTALAMPNDRKRCLEAGMDEYISKPVNLRALVKIIQSCLLNEEEKTKPR